MKYIKLILILISLYYCSCLPQKYEIHIGESYYPKSQQLSFYGSSLIAEADTNSVIEIKGVYCARGVFLDRYPIIRIYDQKNGKSFIPLSKGLEYKDGILISIKGKVVKLPITYSVIKKTINYNHLEPISYQVIYDTQEIIKKVNKEYHEIREKLQEQITIEQSKLQLIYEPEWNIWYDEQKNFFIFSSHQYDLMYAADIELIVDADSKTITDLYAREWFKGEM